MIRIAVDAMGGDHAPSGIVDGAVAAARHLDIQISLVGAPAFIEQALERHADWRHVGVAGLAIVGHGRSSPKAVRNAIAMAYRFAREECIPRIEQEIAASAMSPHLH
jgi:fatty acid/phospholipid biosynthesis enzyme